MLDKIFLGFVYFYVVLNVALIASSIWRSDIEEAKFYVINATLWVIMAELRKRK